METNNISQNIFSDYLNSGVSTNSSILKQQLTQNFETVMTEMLMATTLGSNSSLFDSSTTSSAFSTYWISLIEKFLGTTSIKEYIAPDTVVNNEDIQINQFEAETMVGGDGRNANCGPTSLAMGLHALGLCVKGEDAGMCDGEVVDLSRLSMVYDPSRDGVDSLGKRIEAEHSTYTTLSDIIHGATVSGANATEISADTNSIQKALSNNSVVIVSGTFAGKLPPPWTGDRGVDNLSAPGHATAHVITVSGYNEKTNTFTVNDPARKTPLEVSPAALQYFMYGNAGAIALSRK